MEKVWLITGFGRAIASVALQAGYRVAVAARKTGAIQDLVDTYPQTAMPLKLDVTDYGEIKSAVAEVAEKFGRIDLRLLLGRDALEGARAKLLELATDYDAWEATTLSCDYTE